MHSKRISIASSLDPEVHARFSHWCREQNRSMRGALRQIVQDAVAGVEVPDVDENAARKSVPSTPVAAPTPSRPVVPLEWSQFDPQRNLFDRLAKDEWIPEAIAAVRQQCEDFGVQWTPKLPPQHWLAKYRERAVIAGRDADADIAAGGG